MALYNHLLGKGLAVIDLPVGYGTHLSNFFHLLLTYFVSNQPQGTIPPLSVNPIPTFTYNSLVLSSLAPCHNPYIFFL